MIKYGCHATAAATTVCSEDPVGSYRAPEAAAHRPHRALQGSHRLASRDPRVEVAALGSSPPRVEVTALASPPPRVETAARRADALARSLCAARERITLPLAQLAASLCRERAWSAFGFARASDFALEYLDRSGRWLRDLAALHSALTALPGLDAALTGDDGGPPLGCGRALLIGRVAGAGTLAAWIALARRLTVLALRQAVARARRAGADADGPAVAGDSETPPAQDAVPGGPAWDAGDHDTKLATIDDEADDDRVLLRIATPSALLAAFDEAVDLHRAVEGSETTIASFVEALVAEACAADPAAAEGAVSGAPEPAGSAEASLRPGASSSDIERAGIRHGPRPSIVEEALARSTGGWSHLPEKNDASWGLALGRSTLRRLAALAGEGDRGSPAERVSRMRALLSIETEIEVRLGRLLATMGEDRAWTRLRFAGVGHYAEERLGLSRTAAQSRARAARLLGCFPRVREAYEGGALGLEAALVVGRVLAAPAAGGAPAERAWVRHAREVTVKRLRDEARAIARDGAVRPAGAPSPDRHAGLAAPSPLSDDSWHASLSRAPGTAHRRVGVLGMLAIGARPVEGAIDASAPLSLDADDPAPLAASFCPATAVLPKPDVFLRLTLPCDLADRFLAAVEGARARCAREAETIAWYEEDAEGGLASGGRRPAAEHAPAGGQLPVAGRLPAARLAARMFSIASRRVPDWVGLLALLEDFVETWDPPEHADDLSADPIFVRDGWRCAAPACSSRRNLEDHHVQYRSHLGSNGQHNRVCLCRFHHHRGEHGGLASCRGTAPLALTWRLGMREVGRWYRNERRLPGDPGAPGSGETGAPRLGEIPARGSGEAGASRSGETGAPG